MNSDKNKPITLVSAEEAATVARSVRQWLQGFPDRPIGKIEYEFLADMGGICISTVQAAYKTRQYIDGTYEAQYQFNIIYRTIAENADERLAADELLNRFGSWAEANVGSLTIGENIRVRRVRRNNAAVTMARYEKNVEDHQTMLTLTYEVI